MLQYPANVAQAQRRAHGPRLSVKRARVRACSRRTLAKTYIKPHRRCAHSNWSFWHAEHRVSERAREIECASERVRARAAHITNMNPTRRHRRRRRYLCAFSPARGKRILFEFNCECEQIARCPRENRAHTRASEHGRARARRVVA